MFSIKYIKLAATLLCLAFATTALGQEQREQSQAQPGTEASAQKSALRNRVFEIKYRDPESLIQVLKLLGSGSGAMSMSSEYRTITVRDYPENIATIEDAIKRLDTPVPPAPTIEFHIHILIATNAANASNPVPAELSDVIKQLQMTLNYKNYYVMTSAVLRTKAGTQGVSNKGVADFRLNTEGAARNSPIFYDYIASPVALNPSEAGTAQVAQIGAFQFNMRIPVEVNAGQIQYENVGFKTPVSVREGERVVVGTTTMQDKGVIVVISAKVIK